MAVLTTGVAAQYSTSDKLAARALVAKTHQGQVGVKILKIYSLTQWGKLRRDGDVQIVKGDDSTFMKKPEDAAATDVPRIKDEDDLYTKDVVIEDDVEFDDALNRILRENVPPRTALDEAQRRAVTS